MNDQTREPPAAGSSPIPFSPPSIYSFEPELHGPAPRRIPEELRQGRYARNRRYGILALLGSGALCVAASFLPIVDDLGRYFLPLEYLDWIGIGLLLLGAGSFVAQIVVPGPFRYVVDGIPTVALIRDIVKEPAQIVNGQVVHYRFRVRAELVLPDSRGPVLREIQSPNFSAARKDHVTTSFRVGDYVTAVFLPGDPAGTLNLYGFLNLRSGLGLVDRQRASDPSWPVKVAVEVAAVVVLFAVLIWNLYAFTCLQPLEPFPAHSSWVMIVSGIVLGGGFLLASYLGHRRELRQIAERNAEAIARGEALETDATSFWARTGIYGFGLKVVILAGGLLLGGATGLCWAYSANALLDGSEPSLQPVEIDQAWVKSYSFIFRQYVVDYRFADEAENREFYTTPEGVSALLHSDRGNAEVRGGWLGWPWVERIRPTNGS